MNAQIAALNSQEEGGKFYMLVYRQCRPILQEHIVIEILNSTRMNCLGQLIPYDVQKLLLCIFHPKGKDIQILICYMQLSEFAKYLFLSLDAVVITKGM